MSEPLPKYQIKPNKIWHTYMYRARKLTRSAVETDSNIRIKPKETDNKLVCAYKTKPASFYHSLHAIVFNIFVAEYRINLVADSNKIENNKLRNIINESENSQELNKKNKFKELNLYLKWRNILRVLEIKETKKYIDAVKSLNRWIKHRNKIAHADYKKIKILNITPRKALSCYEAVMTAIFELNVALDGGERANNMRQKKEMNLKIRS